MCICFIQRLFLSIFFVFVKLCSCNAILSAAQHESNSSQKKVLILLGSPKPTQNNQFFTMFQLTPSHHPRNRKWQRFGISQRPAIFDSHRVQSHGDMMDLKYGSQILILRIFFTMMVFFFSHRKQENHHKQLEKIVFFPIESILYMRHLWCFHMFFQMLSRRKGSIISNDCQVSGGGSTTKNRDLPYQQSMVNIGLVKPKLKTSWMVGMIYCPRGYNSTIYIYIQMILPLHPCKSH